MAMDERGENYQVAQTSQRLSIDDFKEYYCEYYHRGVYCGVEQTGRTVIKSRSSEIRLYVDAVVGDVQIELAEKVNGAWVTTHTEVTQPGFIARAYTFDEERLRRARVIRANNDVYHIAVLTD